MQHQIGDKVKIKSGPYKGKVALLKRHDAMTESWFCWIEGLVEIVYDHELGVTIPNLKKRRGRK